MQSKAEKRQLLDELLTQAEKIGKSNIFKAQSLGKPAYELAEELGDENAMAKAVYYLCIGFCYGQEKHNIRLVNKALQMIDPSEEIFIIRFYNLLGLNEVNKSCYAMAMEYYVRALELAEKLGATELIFMMLNNFGELFRNLGDERRALAYYHEAYDLVKDTPSLVSERFFTCLLDNLLICHSMLHEFEQAKYYMDYLDEIHASGKRDTIWSDHAKGCYYKALLSPKEAIVYFDQFLQATADLDVVALRIDAYKHLGDCHKVLNQEYQALESYNLGYELAKAHEAEEASIYCMSKMMETYKAMGKADRALECFDEMNDQVFKWSSKRKATYSDYMMHKIKFSQLEKAKRYVEEEHRQALIGHECTQKAYKRLDLAVDIGNALKSKPSLRELLAILNKQIRSLMRISSIGIASYHQDGDRLDLFYIVEDGVVKDDLYFDLKRPEHFNLKNCVRTRSSIVFRNKEEDTSDYLADYKHQNAYDDIQSAIYVPIISGDCVKGVLTVQSKDANAYNSDDLKLLEIISAYFSQINFNDDSQ